MMEGFVSNLGSIVSSAATSAADSLSTLDLSGIKVPTSLTNFTVDTVLGNQPRGLSNFIAEIRLVCRNFIEHVSGNKNRNTFTFARACKTKQEEQTRVDAELGNIRGKFSSTANLSGYQKKKYIWKLCYIHMLVGRI